MFNVPELLISDVFNVADVVVTLVSTSTILLFRLPETLIKRLLTPTTVIALIALSRASKWPETDTRFEATVFTFDDTFAIFVVNVFCTVLIVVFKFAELLIMLAFTVANPLVM